MLTQNAANHTWIKGKGDSNLKLVSVGIQTWNNQWSYRNYKGQELVVPKAIWRKHQMFKWKGKTGSGLNSDGTIHSNDVVAATNFNWWNKDQEPAVNSGWEKVNEVIRYNKYSAVVESEDVNGNRVSSKYDINNEKVIASSNAYYTDMFYAGFEDYSKANNGLAGEVSAVTNTVSTAHTGLKGYQLVGNWNVIQNKNNRAGDYKVSLWVYQGNEVKVNNQIADEQVKVGSWTLNNYYLKNLISGATITLSGNAIIDDFRVYPITSSMTSYVYNDWNELWYIIGNNGLATRYEYDPAGRLKTTFMEYPDKPDSQGGFKRSSEHRYHYKNLQN